MFASILAVMLVGIEPQAVMTAPETTWTGAAVVFDARETKADFPLVWAVTPPGPILLPFDKDGKQGVVSLFTATKPGVYDVILVASGWRDKEKGEFTFSAAASRILVKDPNPNPHPGPDPDPNPPPADPLAKAAFNFRNDLLGAYARNYGLCADSIHAHKPLTQAQVDLASAMSTSARSAFRGNFAPWESQFPPAGTEPTTDVQWKVAEDLMRAISRTFAP